jgi:predicted nucleic-acid-binding protein
VIAVDTNVVVRLLTGDEPRQTDRARHLFETETVFLPKTVLLEAEWVLRRLYRLQRGAVVRGLEALISLPNVRCEDESAVSQALAWGRTGMDFADALHLAASRAAERFATFDRALIKVAVSAASEVPVVEP